MLAAAQQLVQGVVIHPPVLAAGLCSPGLSFCPGCKRWPSVLIYSPWLEL